MCMKEGMRSIDYTVLVYQVNCTDMDTRQKWEIWADTDIEY